MPGCNQTLTGIAKDCGPNIGGISQLLLINRDDVQVPAVDPVSGKIKSIVLIEGATFKSFALPKGVASLQSTLNVDQANGTNFVTNTLNLGFNRMDTQKRVAVSALAVNELAGLVRDNNGKWWYLGIDEGLMASGGDSGTGAAKTDANRYGLVLSNEEATYPPEVDTDSVDIDALVNGGSPEAPTITGAAAIAAPNTAGSKTRTYATSDGSPILAAVSTPGADWLTASANGNQLTVTYTAQAAAAAERTAEVAVTTATGGSKTVTVTQAAGE